MKLLEGTKVLSIDWLMTKIIIIRKRKELCYLNEENDLRIDMAHWDYTNGFCQVFDHPTYGKHFAIFLRRKDRFVIIHESIHIVHMIFDYKGIPMSLENTETVAYMITHICETLFNMNMKE